MTFNTDVSVMYSMLVEIEAELEEKAPSIEKLRLILLKDKTEPCLKCGFILPMEATVCENCGKPRKEEE